MRPIRLEISAFGPYAEETILDFQKLGDERLFLITGPTGAGKSTIFEAITYALYGIVGLSSGKHKELRSDFAYDSERKTFVQFDFAIHQKKYRIKRQPAQRVPKKRGGGWKDEPQSVILSCLFSDGFAPLTKLDEVTEKVKELVGLDSEQFKKIVMIPQGEFRRFLIADTKDKGAILRHLFDTSLYQRLREKSAQDTRVLQIDIRETELMMQQYVKQIDWPLGVLSDMQNISGLGGLIVEDASRLLSIQNAIQFFQDLQAEKSSERREAEVLHQWFNEERALLVEQEKLEKKAVSMKELEKEINYFRQIDPLLKRQADLVEAKKRLQDHEKQVSNKQAEKIIVNKQFESVKQTLIQLKDEGVRIRDFIVTIEVLKNKIAMQEKYESVKKAFNGLILKYQQVEKNNQYQQAILNKIEIEQKQAQEQLVALLEEQSTIGNRREELVTIEQKLDQLRDVLRLIRMCQKNDYDKQKLIPEVLRAEKTEKEAYEAWQKILAKDHDNWASILAKDLNDGVPCPVCGSIDHPYPKQFLDQEREGLSHMQAESVWREARSVYQEKSGQLNGLHGALEASIGELSSRIPEFLDYIKGKKWQELKELIESSGRSLKKTQEMKVVELKKIDGIAKDIIHFRTIIKNQAEQFAKIREKQRQTEHELNVLSEEKNKQAGVLESMIDQHGMEDVTVLKKQLTEAIKTIETYEQRHQVAEKDYEIHQAKLTTLESELATWNSLISEEKILLKKQEEDFERECLSVFATMDLFRQASLRIAQKDSLTDELQIYQETVAHVRNRLKKLKELIQGKSDPLLEKMDEELHELSETIHQYVETKSIIQQRHDRHRKIAKEIADTLTVLQEKEKQYSLMATLDKLISGDNSWRMDLETFILVTYFEEVLVRANERLQRMSDGRFYFVRQVGVSDRRKSAGLSLDVMDEYTGRTRDVLTLSGGESFNASLALALGLADVVSEESGGIEMDTVFIDEGFGTLDEDSLDKTIDTLFQLQSGGRLVGVISHVGELKERIQTKLVVTKSNRGSDAHFEVLS